MSPSETSGRYPEEDFDISMSSDTAPASAVECAVTSHYTNDPTRAHKKTPPARNQSQAGGVLLFPLATAQRLTHQCRR